MNRRTLLKAATAAMGVGCARASGTTITPIPQLMAPRLAPVNVDADRIIRTVVGLRPFRPSGFRVEADRLGEKLLVHNYGHGGAGVTLSWGTAHLAVEHVRDMEATRAAVLGCGVVGLSTALLLQEQGWDVTIYAKDLPPNTQLTALLPQPEVDYILIAQGRYMMPRSDGIMLGGTHERGVSTMEPDWDAAERIVEGHRRFFAAMT